MESLRQQSKGPGEWMLENSVTLIFIAFTLFGFMVSSGVSLGFFLSELSTRVFRNAFLVLSLIIPVLAGLGLNFGIVIGAMSGQVAVTLARYYDMGGVSGLLFCFAVAGLVAALCGYLTGLLYNKTRGQEMIASLIVGYFANGIYQFLFLFVVGWSSRPRHPPLIKPDGGGIRMTVDLIPAKKGGHEGRARRDLPDQFVHALLIIAVALLAILLVRYYLNKRRVRLQEQPSALRSTPALPRLAGLASTR